MKKMIYLVMLIILAGCTPQQQLSRLIKQNPELAKEVIKIDTIQFVYADTLFVPGFSIDTVFSFVKDTVFSIKTDSFIAEVTKRKGDYVLDLIFKDKPIYVTDTIQIPILDTIQQIRYTGITSTEVWQYRKQGFVIFGAVLLALFLLFALLKTFF